MPSCRKKPNSKEKLGEKPWKDPRKGSKKGSKKGPKKGSFVDRGQGTNEERYYLHLEPFKMEDIMVESERGNKQFAMKAEVTTAEGIKETNLEEARGLNFVDRGQGTKKVDGSRMAHLKSLKAEEMPDYDLLRKHLESEYAKGNADWTTPPEYIQLLREKFMADSAVKKDEKGEDKEKGRKGSKEKARRGSKEKPKRGSREKPKRRSRSRSKSLSKESPKEEETDDN